MRNLRALILTLSIFSSGFAQAQTFPCTIKDNPTSKIILFGEIHEHPAFRMPLLVEMERTKDGNEIFAREGLLFPETAFKKGAKAPELDYSKPVGFDSAFSYGLNYLVDIRFQYETAFVKDYDSIESWKINFVGHSQENIYIQEAWQNLKSKRPFDDKNEERFAVSLDQIYANPKDQTKIQLLKEPSAEVNTGFLFLIKDLGAEYVAMAKSDKYRDIMHVPSNVYLAENSLNGKDLVAAIQELAVKWRNRDMAENLSQLYCQAQEQNKNLFVEVGSEHITNLRERLEDLTQRKVEIEIRGLDIVARVEELKALENLPSGTTDIGNFSQGLFAPVSNNRIFVIKLPNGKTDELGQDWFIDGHNAKLGDTVMVNIDNGINAIREYFLNEGVKSGMKFKILEIK